MVTPLSLWCTSSWWYLTWDFLGRIAVFFLHHRYIIDTCNAECDSHPPTLRTVFLSQRAFNLCNPLCFFRLSPIWSLSFFMSSAKASSWASLIMKISASLLLSSEVTPTIFGWSPLNSLMNLLSLATALTTLNQSKNLAFSVKLLTSVFSLYGLVFSARWIFSAELQATLLMRGQLGRFRSVWKHLASLLT